MGVPALTGLALLAALGWVSIVAARQRFWWPGPWLPPDDGDPLTGWPAVAAVVPARNEAEHLRVTVPTLAGQDYPGRLRIVVVDDESTDDTAATARHILAGQTTSHAWQVIGGEPTPAGWAGKVWAMAQGRRAAGSVDWLWFTDADITHNPDVLRRLVRLGESRRLDVVSVMAVLRTATIWEKLVVPVFVYFFALLYPFRSLMRGGTAAAAVGARTARSARRGKGRRRPRFAAAGGCLLVRADVLDRAGGLAAIRSALIDDLALAKLIAVAGGQEWLGFDTGVRSVRGYQRFADLWRMISRSAYTQLNYSLLRLLGVLLGLGLLFAVPPIAVVVGAAHWQSTGGDAMVATALGAGAWLLASGSLTPTLRRVFRLSPLWAMVFPMVGLLYAAMTAHSAWAYYRGRPISWRGRAATVTRSGGGHPAASGSRSE
ncbi:MAG: glycosyltransferase [Acidothermus cellulolyticus]|nr:glycosyltransferase [Acidothermus cellulolyticus]